MSTTGGERAQAPKARGGALTWVGVAAVIVVVVLLLTVARPSFLGGDSAGSKARDYVSSAYPKLVVEVDWLVEGGKDYKPSLSVLGDLQQKLTARLSKPGGVTVQLGNAITAAHTAYSVADLRDAEGANRATHTGGDTASIWMVFANRYTESANVIGVAYSGSAVAIFAATIEGASTFAVSIDAIEKVTTLHEVGHLLGLVNGGTPMVTPHEDAAHRGHSSNTHSVMYWQVEGTDVVSLFLGGGPPDDFDANDIADLHAIGGP